MSKIVELFGHHSTSPNDWRAIVRGQECPYLGRKCIKVRKSQPEISIGTCTVDYGSRTPAPVIICPYRFRERYQVFLDCVHLLTLHEPGNELHIIPEVSVPGGSVDYFLVSSSKRKVRDFVGIELQTLDTTGTVWPERQRFIKEKGMRVEDKDVKSSKSFGMNWKMTAKTILVQLHHKVSTFEHLSKHFVLVIQDSLASYMKREFDFAHVMSSPRLGDPMHFHSYTLVPRAGQAALGELGIELSERFSTDTAGIAKCLDLQAESKVELEVIVQQLENKMSDRTLLKIG